MENKLVSIVVPTYKRPHLLGRTLNSILMQTYKKIEIIVVDDDEKQSALLVINQLNSDKITYYRNEGKGANYARNLGISKSKGDFITFCDDDDTFYPDKIEKQVRKLLEDESSFVYCASERIYENNDKSINYKFIYKPKSCYSPFFKQYLYTYSFISTQTFMCTRGGINRFGTFDLSIRKGQDWDFVLNFYSKGAKFSYIDEPLVTMFFHTGERISSIESQDLILDVVRKYQSNYTFYTWIFIIFYFLKKRDIKTIVKYYSAICTKQCYGNDRL